MGNMVVYTSTTTKEEKLPASMVVKKCSVSSRQVVCTTRSEIRKAVRAAAAAAGAHGLSVEVKKLAEDAMMFNKVDARKFLGEIVMNSGRASLSQLTVSTTSEGRGKPVLVMITVREASATVKAEKRALSVEYKHRRTDGLMSLWDDYDEYVGTDEVKRWDRKLTTRETKFVMKALKEQIVASEGRETAR